MRTEAPKTIGLALPIIIGELAQQALHLIDIAMVGKIDYKLVSAAALVVNTLNIPFVFGIGITISVSQMVSLAHGRRDSQLVSHYFFNGFVLCSIIAILISIVLVSGRNILFHLGQDPEVAILAIPFMKLMSWSIIPMLLFMTLKQFTDGLEFTRTAMILAISGLPINVFLNWLLIYGNLGFPRLELVGAGWATLITRTLLFTSLSIIILRHPTFRKYIAVRKKQWKVKLSTIKDLLHIGIPSSLQLGMESGAFAISGIIIGTIGAIEQASHQIALSCVAVTYMVSMGLSQAGSIRVSNAYGRHNWSKIDKIGKSTIWTAVIYAVLCAAFLIACKDILPTFFINKEDEVMKSASLKVIKLASLLLFFAAIFQIPDSTQAITAGLLRGIKDVKIPTILVFIAYWVVGLPIGYLLAFNLKMGPSGIWIGLIIGLTLTSFSLIGRFLKMIKRNKI